ncbi:sigma factor [Butyrivibrio sp. NC2002]|uniref:sigma factor n=1 Tax=Butyrivibrio sp. NC2002 TaxID=1410610 RepID=UPI00068E33BC|nr:sigma factor [Butyrivibrio sp. NC2002]
MASEILATEVLAAKNDNKALTELVRNNDKFIRKCAYFSVHRFITEHDDEYSIALSAFLEAVSDYDSDKGEFSTFAQTVISRRLYNYLRTEYRWKPEISVNPTIIGGDIPEEEVSEIAIELKQKNAELGREESAMSSAVTVSDEVNALTERLQIYGIEFSQLVKSSPTSGKTKLACRTLLNTMMNDDELLAKYKKSHTIPVMALASASGISKKIIDRYRRYLIASLEILLGDYPLLSTYLK